MKKLLLILIGVLLSLPVLAADGDKFSYTYQGQTLNYTILSETDKTVGTKEGVSGNSAGNEVSGDLILPEKVIYNDVEYTLISIGNCAFSSCTGLTSIEIPNSVTSIGQLAFYNCTRLTNIEIPNSVSEIGYRTFGDCIRLTSVTIGNSVTSIGSYAFENCTDLTDIEIPNSVISIGSYAFEDCTGLKSVVIGNLVTSIGKSAFYRCSGLTGVVIPNSVTEIGDYAFYGCGGMTDLTIGNSVTSIGKYAFYGCGGLTGVVIPKSMTEIGEFAFIYCTGLIKNACPNTIESPFNYGITITYPADNSEIEDGIIYGKDKSSIWFVPYNIEDGFEIPNSVIRIGNGAFLSCTDLTMVEIPNSVTEIGVRAFENCTGLTDVTIGNSVASIGNGAFNACTGLTSVTIGNSVTSIGERSFSGCTALTDVTIPNSVTEIGVRAFENCTGLTEVTIGNSVASIGNYAFSGCTALTGLTIGNSVASIGNYAFSGCTALTGVIIPNSVTSIGESAFAGCTGLIKSAYPDTIEKPFHNGINIKYPADNSEIEDGIIYGKDKSAIWFVPSNYEGYFNIPNSVTSIGNTAFYGCNGLTGIEIPNSVTSIGNSVFYYCEGLTSVTIPNSVISIGAEAFRFCTSLTDVTIGNSVTSIGNLAFNGCTSLIKNACPDTIESPFSNGITIIYPADNSEMEDGVIYSMDKSAIWFVPYNIEDGFEIPNSVTEIGKGAFQNCTILTSVVIPPSVTTIGTSAFAGCTGLIKSAFPDYFYMNPFPYGATVRYPTRNSEMEDGIIYGKDKSAIWFVPYNVEDGFEIPNSVTEIGVNSFSYCTDLTRIEIPNSVASIGNYAFNGCTGLTSVDVNWENPVNIKSDTFSSDTYNNAILNIQGNIWAAYLSSGWNNFDNINYGGNIIVKITDDTFTYRYNPAGGEAVLIQNEKYKSLTTVTIPDRVVADGSFYKVTGIGNDAFKDCSNITSVILPQYLVMIGNSSFQNCTGLTGIEISNSVTEIGDYVFYGCTGLTGIEIPNSVTSIGDYAFSGCTGLTGIEIPNSVTEIGEYIFYRCTGLKSAVIGNSVTLINTCAFYGCTGLTGIEIPNSVTKIGGSAFSDCSGLTSVEIPNSVTSIGSSAFSYCEGLTGIEIPNSVTEIRSSTFSYCKGLTSVTIPNSVASIGNGAFYSCESLTGVTIPNSVTSIGESAFSLCSGLTSVVIPNSVTSIGESAFYYCESLTGVTIGNSVTSIGKSAFSYCEGLTGVTIGNSVTEIGSWAFNSTAISSINLPPSLERLYSNAFYNCGKLNTVTISQSYEPLNIDGNLFEGLSVKTLNLERNLSFRSGYGLKTTTLEQVNFGGSVSSINDGLFSNNANIKTVVIPSSVEYIGESAFENTGLTSIAIGAGIQEIGDKAFAGCSPSTIAITATTSPKAVNTTFSYIAGKLYVTPGYEDEYYDNPNCWYRFSYPTALVEATDLKVTSKKDAAGNIKLNGTVEPSGASLPYVIWKSEDTSLASVDPDGTVHFYGDASSCGITATTLYADGPTVSLVLNSDGTIQGEVIEAESITLDVTNAELTVGDTLELKATVLPEDTTDKTLTWSSSNENVATVSEAGVVTAIAEGYAIITVSCGEVSANCEITVVNPVVDAEKIVLNMESAEVIVGKTIQLIATVLPENTTDKTLIWSSSNENVATVSEEGVVTAIAVGNAIVTVSCGGVSAECEITVTEEAGIESLLANPDSKISVYSTGGFLIKKDCKVEDLKLLDKGIYIIISGKERYKISI